MGRTKGSVNKTKKDPKEKPTSIKNDKDTSKTKNEVVHVPILEEPLMVFVCRRCQGNFYSTEEYQSHDCPAQIYAVVSEEVPPQEDEPKKTKSPKKSKLNINEITSGEEKETFKKPRKPYKKREKEPKEKQEIACEKCGKSFTRKYHLERHLIHTQCNPGNIQREEFHCEVCNKPFSRIDNLRMHLRAHLGVKSKSRDFQCPYCEKAFYGSSLLNIHVRSHTKVS